MIGWLTMKTEAPEMYGMFHLCALVLCVLGAYGYTRWTKGKEERFLFRTGLVLFVLECAKQVFIFRVLNRAEYYNWWYVPFQLCSVPMYLCLCLPFLKEPQKQTVYGFLSSYAFIGTLCALVYPEDMLREYWFLSVHGFLWHGILLGISLTCRRITVHSGAGFRPVFLLFCVLCVCAELINTAGYCLHTAGSAPDMFYISPFLPAEQPVFSTIGRSFGRGPEIIVYLGVLSLGSSLLFRSKKKESVFKQTP